jgi:hypothetical protein
MSYCGEHWTCIVCVVNNAQKQVNDVSSFCTMTRRDYSTLVVRTRNKISQSMGKCFSCKQSNFKQLLAMPRTLLRAFIGDSSHLNDLQCPQNCGRSGFTYFNLMKHLTTPYEPSVNGQPIVDSIGCSSSPKITCQNCLTVTGYLHIGMNVSDIRNAVEQNEAAHKCASLPCIHRRSCPFKGTFSEVKHHIHQEHQKPEERLANGSLALLVHDFFSVDVGIAYRSLVEAIERSQESHREHSRQFDLPPFSFVIGDPFPSPSPVLAPIPTPTLTSTLIAAPDDETEEEEEAGAENEGNVNSVRELFVRSSGRGQEQQDHEHDQDQDQDQDPDVYQARAGIHDHDDEEESENDASINDWRSLTDQTMSNAVSVIDRLERQELFSAEIQANMDNAPVVTVPTLIPPSAPQRHRPISRLPFFPDSPISSSPALVDSPLIAHVAFVTQQQQQHQEQRQQHLDLTMSPSVPPPHN